jgi:hypothetical protein
MGTLMLKIIDYVNTIERNTLTTHEIYQMVKRARDEQLEVEFLEPDEFKGKKLEDFEDNADTIFDEGVTITFSGTPKDRDDLVNTFIHYWEHEA